MRTLTFFFFVCFATFSAKQMLAQTIIYVDSSRVSGANNGSSWTNAYTSLQSALTAATGTSVIWVAKGTYFPSHNTEGTATTNRYATFYINKEGLKVYGGFSGTEASLNDRNIPANPTILTGDIGTGGDISDNTYHVLYIRGSLATGNITAATVVDGFTIRGGNANASDAEEVGGGAYLNGSGPGNICSPTISKCTFSANNAVRNGGAVYANGSSGNCSPTITGCTFSGNTAADRGGALFTNGSFGTSKATLTNCNFLGNTAAGSGGAFFSNGAFGTGGSTLVNCSFSGNNAVFEGGAVYNNGESGTNNCVLTNCSFSGNNASSGAAIYNDDGTVNCVVRNSVITGNSSGIQNNSATTTIFYSLVQGETSTSDGNISSAGVSAGDVFVSPVAETSAPTTSGDYRLKNSSPAINRGSDSLYEMADDDAANNSLTNDKDLMGENRLAGSSIDMGAYEYTGVTSIGTPAGQEPGISLYPNPAKNELMVTGLNGGEWIQISDMNGGIRYRKQAEKGQLNISLRQFSSGIYQVQTFGKDGGRSSHKVVIYSE